VVARRRGFLVNGLLAAVSIAVALGGLEVAFRLFDVSPAVLPPRAVEIRRGDVWEPVSAWGTTPLKQPSPFPEVAMGEYRPGIVFRFAYYASYEGLFRPAALEHEAVAHVNAAGLRGPDLTADKPADEVRVLFLGDSFTFGEGVADDEPFPVLVAAALGRRDPGVRYRAINAGVSGYNTRDEVAYLEHRWLAYAPDLVVLTFYLNDAYDDARFAPLIMGRAHGQLLENVQSPSRVVRWAQVAVRRRLAGRRTREVYAAQFSDAPAVPGHDWRDSQAALRHAATLLAGRGIPFVLVVFPELYDLGASHPFTGIYDTVESFGRSLPVPVLNLYPTFRGRDAASLWVHPTDHHPNAAAHRLAAEAITAFLVRHAAEVLPHRP
jgi:lysophospholipase L1-like esterase